MLRLAWLAIAVGAASTALAGTDARAALEKGRDLYLRLDFRAAVEQLKGAAAQFEAAFPETGDSGPLAESLTLLAASQVGLKDEAAARETFAQLLRMRPDFRVDVNMYGPKVAQAFEHARTAAASQTRTSLEILCEPEGDVVLDGAPRGKTPFHLKDLPAGRHALRLDAPGHEPWWGMIDVAVTGSSYPFRLKPLVAAPVASPALPAPPQSPPAEAAEVAPAPKPTSRDRLHAYGALFGDVLHRTAGGEVGVSLSVAPVLDVVASATIGPSVGGQLGLTLSTPRASALFRPFAQIRGVVLPTVGSVAIGGGVWLGGTIELGPGRVLAGASGEVYSAPSGYSPFVLLIQAGYEFDIL